jgi:hypothetical protein
MVDLTKVNGKTTGWMDTESFFIRMVKLPMKDIGYKMSLMGLGVFIMRFRRIQAEKNRLIILIFQILKTSGNITKANLIMI